MISQDVRRQGDGVLFNEKSERFTSLMRKREYSAAAALASESRRDAARTGEGQEAAHFSVLLATAHVIMGLDDEALRDYEEAETLDPSNPTLEVKTAAHLLYALNSPEIAAEKLERAIPALARRPEYHYELPEALGLEGVAWLRLGRTKEAAERFEALSAAASSGPLKPPLDLRLVEELIERGLQVDGCRSYLHEAMSWAERSRNDDLLKRATRLHQRLEESGTHR